MSRVGASNVDHLFMRRVGCLADGHVQLATSWAVERHAFFEMSTRYCIQRSRGVSAGTLDSESSDSGANPREAFHSSGRAMAH